MKTTEHKIINIVQRMYSMVGFSVIMAILIIALAIGATFATLTLKEAFIGDTPDYTIPDACELDVVECQEYMFIIEYEYTPQEILEQAYNENKKVVLIK